jgi:hypothetical protein
MVLVLVVSVITPAVQAVVMVQAAVAAGVRLVVTVAVQVVQLFLVQLLQHTLTTAQFMDQ